MACLQGAVISPCIRGEQTRVNIFAVNAPSLSKAISLKSGFLGSKVINSDGMNNSCHQMLVHKWRTVQCASSSSSNNSGFMAENFDENDEDYMNASIIEAVDVRNGRHGFAIKMKDGSYLRCVPNNPDGGRLPDYDPHPAMVLRMEDDIGLLLLSIIVSDMQSMMLMSALSFVKLNRPPIYTVMLQMIVKMGYAVKLVRVTSRVHEAYCAKVWLVKVGSETEGLSLDLRASDAINVAVRSKVPIQVNKHLANSDGMRVLESSASLQSTFSEEFVLTELDRPSDQPCDAATEFNLLLNMLVAVNEERYKDAAEWRDKLTELRSKKKKWA